MIALRWILADCKRRTISIRSAACMRSIPLPQQWDIFDCQRLTDSPLEARVSALLRGIHYRKPGLTIVAMGDDAERLTFPAIDQQNNHLAVTPLGAVMGTRAVGRAVAGNVQVKGANDAQAGAANLPAYPVNGNVIWLCQNQEWWIFTHVFAPSIE